jgi:TonB family protein
MFSAGGLIVSILVNSVWQIPLIAGAGWLAARVLRRLGPQAEHSISVVTLMAATLTPVLQPLWRLVVSLSVQGAVQSRLSMAAAIVRNTGSSGHNIYMLPTAVLWLVFALYFGSVASFAIRLARSLRFTGELLGKAGPIVLTQEQSILWDRCKRSFSLSAVRILGSSRLAGPVALGLREPVLLLPPTFPLKCSPPDFFAALAHECAHIQRRDFTKNLFYEAASLLFAFHPAIWFIKAQIAQTREMVCDAMATESLVESHRYAQSLLRLAALVATAPQLSATPAIGIFDANILEKRIMIMNSRKLPVRALFRLSLLIPTMVILLTVAAGSAAMAVVVEPQSQSQNATQDSPYGPVYKVGKDVTAPVVLKSVEAKFPKSGHDAKMGFHAIVIVRLVVDAEGSPRDVQISRSYNADFDAEAVKAVQQYRFKPAMKDGKPVSVAISIEVDFAKY